MASGQNRPHQQTNILKKYLILFYRGRVKKITFFVANVCFVIWNCIYLNII